MGWRDLLQNIKQETIVFPWCGGRTLQTNTRCWTIEGRLPEELGWHEFTTKVRTARWKGQSDSRVEDLNYFAIGYLVGDRLVPDTVITRPNIGELAKNFERVYMIEDGLDKFVRVKCGRMYQDGPLIFINQEFPLGPENDVLNAFLEEKENINDIAGVTPALDGAFRIEDWYRIEVKKRREEERKRREQEERRQKIRESLGDGEIRRIMALEDFGAAAKAALAVGGAQYLDHRHSPRKDEMIVRFRFLNRRFECVCHAETLRIIDSGICLTDHNTGEKGDTYFTLESLPPVINEAYDGDELVVFRH